MPSHLLVVDVGNTNIVLGIYRDDVLVNSWRMATARERTADEYGSMAKLLIGDALDDSIEGAIVSSVVPPLNSAMSWMIGKYFGIQPLFVEPGVKTGIGIHVDNPQEVGADRIVNCVAAHAAYGGPLIIVDFGTATTFDCITADGKFIGGVIMPGLRTASDELVRKTAKLPATELTPPTRAIGRRTEDCIRAGVLWGTADAVDGLVRRIKAEWPSKTEPIVVATGGLAGLVAPLCKEIESVHPDLTLIGLRIAATALGLKW